MSAELPVSILHRINRYLASKKPVALLASHVMHRIDPLVYELSRQKHTAANLLLGLPVVHLTTTGAKSGKERTVPLLAIPHGEEIILIASNWGGRQNPGWYYNLRQHPQVTVSRDGSPRAYMARETIGEERADYWQKAVELYGGYEAYRRRTADRMIPVIILTPLE